MKCVALDPEYSRKKAHPFACGGMAGILYLREKGSFIMTNFGCAIIVRRLKCSNRWFGDKDTTLQGSGKEPITACQVERVIANKDNY